MGAPPVPRLKPALQYPSISGNLRAFHLILIGALGAYAALFLPMRALGSLPFGLVLVAAGIVTAGVARKYFEPLLAAFALLGLCYVAASYLELFDRSITLMFDPDAIPQQAIYVVALPLLVPAYAYLCERLDQRDPQYLALEWFLFGLCVLANVWEFTQQGSVKSLGIGQMTNPDAMMAFLLVRRMIYHTNIPWGRRAVATMGLFVISRSAQVMLSLSFLGSLLFLDRFRRHALTVFILLFIVAMMWALSYSEQLWALDPNTGIRTIFWKDVIERVILSNGLGVGFGTETIRPSYQYLSDSDVVIRSIDTDRFIFVGSHNAFFDAAYRVGIFGATLLIWYVARAIYRAVRPAHSTGFDCWVAATVFIILGVNVGLASPNFLFGSALLLGWLKYRGDIYAQKQRRRVRRAGPMSRRPRHIREARAGEVQSRRTLADPR